MCYGYDGDEALRRSLETRSSESGGVSRRTLLTGAVTGAAGLALVGAGAETASAHPHGHHGYRRTRRVPPGRISIQLWTVREGLSANYDATLRTIAELGYPRIEQALGYFGRTAAQLRDFYDDIGVRASSSHDGISATEAEMHQKFENAVTLGQRFINVPYLNSTVRSDWEHWAEQMNKEAAVARRYGLAYGYHNHAHEFTTDLGGGVTPWDILTSELDRRYVHLQIDIYWVVTAGVNLGMSNRDAQRFAIETIREAPLRVRQYHVKDRSAADGDMADLGTGTIDFARIFRGHEVGEYIVENDTPDVSPLTSAAVGHLYLDHLEF